MIENIPAELRPLLQWVVWKTEQSETGKPTKVPYNPLTMRRASVIDPANWTSFETACAALRMPGVDGVGFVLTQSDPYCVIDLDNKEYNPITPEQWTVHQRILEHFASYTERSPSRRGYHIVLRGKAPPAVQRDFVEVYGSARYITFTGDVVRAAPILDYQESLDALVAYMSPVRNAPVALEQINSEVSDEYICDMASNATNGAKYLALCKGEWRELGYPSQSEADYALLSMLAFYTLDNAQVLRLFRFTALGKRDKAIRDDRYLMRSLAQIRTNAHAPTAADLANARATAEVIAKETAAKQVTPAARDNDTTLHFPPGLLGELADYFLQTAVRPVREVALAAAIGLLAGVAGRIFNISQTGLNQYLLLIAETGSGKEGISKAIGNLLSHVRAQVAQVTDFIGPGNFASGQGLIRSIDRQHCFLSILGEFGLTLQMLNDPRASAATIMMRRVLLDLYSKSGWSDVLYPTVYSDTEKNTKSVHAPCVTLLGESSPDKFYDAISPADIADGLIPRMQIIEYTGQRPSRNRNAGCPPSPELVNKMAELSALTIQMTQNNVCAPVPLADDALRLLDAFDEECDEAIRNANGRGETQLWNRAHLKSLKLAGIIAVGCNWRNPVVTAEAAQYAIAFTRKGTQRLVGKFFQGEIGNSEQKQAADMRRIIREYFAFDAAGLRTYRIPKDIHKAGFVPYSYLVERTAKLASFYRDPRGTARALKITLEQLVSTEILGQLDQATAFARFGRRQALFFGGNNF